MSFGAADSTRRDHVGPSFDAVLAASRLPFGTPFGPAHTQERLLARDRTEHYELVATIRSAAAGAWWWACTVRAPAADDHEEHGEEWPLDPGAPRPGTPGFAHLTEARLGIITEIGRGGPVVRGGVVGTPVAALELVTPLERHRVEVDAATGAFTAIGPIADGQQAELIARAADGTVLETAVTALDWTPFEERLAASGSVLRTDSVTYLPWEALAPVAHGPLPDWLRPACEAALADLCRSGGAPGRIEFSWEPHGEDAGTFYVSLDGQQRWGAGIATRVYWAALQVDVAFRLQEGFDELSWRYGVTHPACPRHAHALEAEERDDEAWWVCPADGTPVARIGEWVAPQRAD